MSETESPSSNEKFRKTPFYQEIDGFRIPGFFSEEDFRSSLTYKPRADDLFIATYPKCGTTWVQNIVACIYGNGKPFSSVMEFITRSPFLELVGAEPVEKMNRPGAIKTHLPFCLTPWSEKAKYIFIARNPKDCCVSFYYHTKSIRGYEFEDGDFDVYFQLFLEGKVDFGDYFDTLLSWYDRRNDPNVLFITYEQLKKDTRTSVLKIAEFIGPRFKETLERDQKVLDGVINCSSVAYMKSSLNKWFAEISHLPKATVRDNPDIPSGFKRLLLSEDSATPNNIQLIRKGVVGDWRNLLSEDQNKRLEEKFQKRTKGTDIPNLWKDDM